MDKKRTILGIIMAIIIMLFITMLFSQNIELQNRQTELYYLDNSFFVFQNYLTIINISLSSIPLIIVLIGIYEEVSYIKL